MQHARVSSLVIPKFGDEDGWRRLICDDNTESTSLHSITLILFHLDVKTTTRVTNYLLQWIVEDSMTDRARLMWLFALLAALDRPTHPDTDANLRAALRVFCKIRANLVSVDDPPAPDVGVLIAVISGAFGQHIEYI